MSLTALVLGASGETGKEVVRQLAASASYSRVLCLGRRILDLPADWTKVEQAVVDFDALDQSADKFKDVDAAFCCLGTTRAVAGKEGFIKVDHDYVLSAAKLLPTSGCPALHLLSSKGADKNAFLLYPSTKGKVEAAVEELGLARVVVYRPGLLLCDREEQRGGEKVARWVAGWMPKSQGWSIATSTVATAMVATSLLDSAGKFKVMEHEEVVKAGSGE